MQREMHTKERNTAEKYGRNVRMPRGRRETRKEEIPRAAYCASASLQRGREMPGATEGMSEKGAVPGQKKTGSTKKKDARILPKAK